MRNTLMLLGSITLTLIPMFALAQNTNINVQKSSNSAVLAGLENTVNQKKPAKQHSAQFKRRFNSIDSAF